jgi:hypothetical protein
MASQSDVDLLETIRKLAKDKVAQKLQAKPVNPDARIAQHEADISGQIRAAAPVVKKPYATPGSLGATKASDTGDVVGPDYYAQKEKMLLDSGVLKDDRKLMQKLFDSLFGDEHRPLR